MTQKKAISPIIATMILLITTIIATISFQNWLSTYSTSTFSKIELQNKINNIKIEKLINNKLYIKSDKPDTLKTFKISDQNNNIMCEFNENGINNFNYTLSLMNFDNETSTDLSTFSADGQIIKGDKEIANIGSNSNQCVETTNNALSYYNDTYNNWKFKVTSGTAIGQIRTITKYLVNNKINNKIITFNSPINNFKPDDSYEIYKTNIPLKIDTKSISKKGFTFNGIDDYIIIPTFQDLTGRTSITISIWFKPFSNKNSYLISKNGPFQLKTENTLITNLHNPIWNSITGNTPITLNKWNHALFTFNNKTSKLYLNGNLENTTTNPGILTGNGCLIIGRSTSGGCYNGGNLYFNGSIDEMTIYSKSLTKQEVKALYNLKKATFYEQLLPKGIKELDISNCNLKKKEIYNFIGFTNTQKIEQSFST